MRSNPRLVDATNTESFSHFEQEMLLFNEQERMQRQMAKQSKMLDVPQLPLRPGSIQLSAHAVKMFNTNREEGAGTHRT